MPRYFLGIVEDQSAYAPGGPADFDEVMAAHSDFSASVRAAGGTVVSGEALAPTATFLRGVRTDALVSIDNPLPDLKETLGGYYLIDVPGDEVALELAGKCPAPYGYIELRPIWDLS